jgi:ABC-type multidrug transport system fused ATPase/permease subunit
MTLAVVVDVTVVDEVVVGVVLFLAVVVVGVVVALVVVVIVGVVVALVVVVVVAGVVVALVVVVVVGVVVALVVVVVVGVVVVSFSKVVARQSASRHSSSERQKRFGTFLKTCAEWQLFKVSSRNFEHSLCFIRMRHVRSFTWAMLMPKKHNKKNGRSFI